MSSKRHLKLTKLVNIMETKAFKLLRNVKTRWISMINPTKRVIAKYRIKLFVKMGLDMPTNFQVVTNFDVLVGLDILLSHDVFS